MKLQECKSKRKKYIINENILFLFCKQILNFNYQYTRHNLDSSNLGKKAESIIINIVRKNPSSLTLSRKQMNINILGGPTSTKSEIEYSKRFLNRRNSRLNQTKKDNNNKFTNNETKQKDRNKQKI